jgi:hypothetical protein
MSANVGAVRAAKQPPWGVLIAIALAAILILAAFAVAGTSREVNTIGSEPASAQITSDGEPGGSYRWHVHELKAAQKGGDTVFANDPTCRQCRWRT